jgi:hypothetical protein
MCLQAPAFAGTILVRWSQRARKVCGVKGALFGIETGDILGLIQIKCSRIFLLGVMYSPIFASHLAGQLFPLSLYGATLALIVAMKSVAMFALPPGI